MSDSAYRSAYEQARGHARARHVLVRRLGDARRLGRPLGVVPLGVKAVGVGYLENHQTEPDIKVANTQEAVVKGRDEQLEAAIAELLKEIK